jgi:hypothetical protein
VFPERLGLIIGDDIGKAFKGKQIWYGQAEDSMNILNVVPLNKSGPAVISKLLPRILDEQAGVLPQEPPREQ